MNSYHSNKIKPVIICFFILLGFMTLNATSVNAAAGDIIGNVNLPVLGFGVSAGVDCIGNVYYTNNGQNNLYVMDKDGTLLNTLPTTDASTGASRDFDEIAWDQSRGIFWAQLHGSNPVDVFQLDPATGVATFAFTSVTNSLGFFRDGIAYDGTDDTLWITGDVSTTIEHYQADGTYLGQITPKNASGANLGTISGVMVGAGDLLYLGQNGLIEIVQVKKSDGSFIASFASPGGARDEGLECDPVNFAPTLALWSRDVNNFMSVIEIEEGTCLCGGGLIVPVDIKPGSCPNPINVKSKGVLPAAIMGTASLDVTQIDTSTLLLEGVSPLGVAIADVGEPLEPFIGKADCYADCVDCSCADGYLDLVFHFDTQEVVNALADVTDGSCLTLEMTGELLDGTPFVGEDVVIILNKGKQ